MKKFLRSTLAIVLTLALFASFSTCFAAEITKEYLDYGSYVLLGDSIACGWSDIEERDTSFERVEGSYGVFLADDLGIAPENYHPRACIGFRTLEIRYMLEDDFVGDRFMFYSIDQDRVDREIPAIRKEIAEAGIITLNVGGNDWGSFLGWHLFEIMDNFEETNAEFLAQAEAYLEQAGTAKDTINTLIDIASYAGCLEQLVTVLPQALNEGLINYTTNWNIMIEDILALNPDVTLVVVGMFDTALQDESMEDNESEGIQNAATKLEVGQYIVDLANITMEESAKKYDYIFIDPVGTKCELQHPSRAGHRHIADLILAALPYANFPYKDVELGSKEYRAIEYMWSNDIIDGVSENEFAPDAALTMGTLENALAKLAGEEATSTDDAKAKRIDVIKAVLNANENATFMAKLKTFAYAVKCFINNFKFNFLSEITRAEAAVIIYDYINL